MDETVQRTLAITSVVIAFTIGYYFLWVLPQKGIVTRQKDCYQMASSKYEKEAREAGGFGMDPQYKYDEKTDTCLVLRGSIMEGGEVEKAIVNVYTNEGIASYIQDKNNTIIYGDKSDFENKEREYFKNN